MSAQIPQSARNLPDEFTRPLGDERLAAVGGCGDPCAAVHVDAHVVVVSDKRLPRMQTHPHADFRSVRPRLLRQSDLRVGRGGERPARISEGHEETVALRIDLDAAVADERLAQEPPVLRENAGVRVAELVQEARRPLDVREKESDGAGRELGHRPRRQRRAVWTLGLEENARHGSFSNRRHPTSRVAGASGSRG
jgi:hypothetical protein